MPVTFAPTIAGTHSGVLGLSVAGAASRSSVVLTGTATGPGSPVVPDVIGLERAAAEQALRAATLEPGVISEAPHPEVAPGSVVDQQPRAGTTLTAGGAVDLVVSTGPATTKVPKLVGEQQAVAERLLEEAKLRTGAVTQRPDPSEEPGVVLESAPAAEAEVPVGSPVNLVVSAGPPTPAPVVVPDVIGRPLDDARRTLEAVPLTVGTVTEQPDAVVLTGSVLRSTPAAGAQVPSDSTVDLVVSSGPAEPPPCTVPDLTGMSQDQAAAALDQAGLRVGQVSEEQSSTAAKGTLIRTDPAAGAVVAPCGPVNVVLSAGPPPCTVPDVGGSTHDDAAAALDKAGFVPGRVREEPSEAAKGTVIGIDPAAGTVVPAPCGAVNLLLSSGPPPCTVPDVVGLGRGAAVEALQTAGLVLGQVREEPSSDRKKGTVIRSKPVAGAVVPQPCGPVDLVVSSGPERVPVPPVERETLQDARLLLTGYRLEPGTVTQEPHDTVAEGLVIRSDPAPGTEVDVGSAVALVISTGPPPVQVPEVRRMTQDAAVAALRSTGLVAGSVTDEDSLAPAGTIIRSIPVAGTTVARGSAVDLVRSTGPVAVPDVVRKTRTEAEKDLEDAGLAARSPADVDPDAIVVGTTPTAGTLVLRGSHVDLEFDQIG
jgi:beta-lactam-binding protein with PASTA domain